MAEPVTDPTRARLAARTALPASGGGLGGLEVRALAYVLEVTLMARPVTDPTNTSFPSCFGAYAHKGSLFSNLDPCHRHPCPSKR